MTGDLQSSARREATTCDPAVVVSTALMPAAVIFAAAVWLTLAWKTAGWIGFDRWLLPLLGMPWRGGTLFGERPARGNAHRIGRHS